LIRLSVAKKPDPQEFLTKALIGRIPVKEEAFNNFVPGFALKFLRDKIPSGNLVAMYSVNGVETWNFFDKDFPFSNHVTEA